MPETPKNVISNDVEIKGTVLFQNELITDGKIDGDILSSGILTIGRNGSVRGDIQAAVVSVFGTVNGNISVEQRCELRGNAQLIGDLDAPRMVIEEGATFVGGSKVLPTGSQQGTPLVNQSPKRIEDAEKSVSPPQKAPAPEKAPVSTPPLSQPLLVQQQANEAPRLG